MIDPEIAKEVISNLSSGTVSTKYCYTYDVGRTNQLDTVINEIVNNRTKLRFVNGDYGTGKTQFLSKIRYQSIINEYVPSHVILSQRGTPIFNLKAVYSRIIKNLILSENENSSPIESILEFVFFEFKIWLSDFLKCGIERCDKFPSLNPLYCRHCNLNGTIENLYIKNFHKLDLKLQVAIIIYRYARWGYHPDFETADLVIRWLEGEPLYRTNLNYLGAWDRIEEKDILKGLHEIAKLVALLNKKGLVILLDEAEGIEQLSINQRPTAYKNLRFLIEGTKDIENVYFLYATTPTFYQEIYSKSPELAEIVSKTACTNLAPLSKLELEELSKNIAQIFLQAKQIDENLYDTHCSEIRQHIDVAYDGNLSVRNFITNLIELFQN